MRSIHTSVLMRSACWLAFAATTGCFASDPGLNPDQECNDALGMSCPTGELCLEHVCHQVCERSRECDEPNEACSQPDGLCVQYADTCDEGRPCVEGFFCGESDGVCRKFPEFVDCDNQVQDGGETDIDCGGPYCEHCDPGDDCGAHTDCASRVCSTSTNTCAAPACDDTVENGDESDVDCGGPSMVCPRCDSGADCYGAADCESNVCTQEICQEATCTDGVLNGTESDTDCGIGCPLCADGRPCNSADDCTSGVCDHVCQVPACNDEVANGTETDTDCGGTCPVRCPDNAGCGGPEDCISGVCTDHTCQAPTCVDGVENGDETDVDCGGESMTCPRCETGGACEQPGDCASGVCGVMGCVAPNCDDGVHNGDESDTDCGGPCDPCPDGAMCFENVDCTSNRCGGVCLFVFATFGSPSTDTVKDIAFAPNGDLTLVGTYSEAIDFGGGPLPPTESDDYPGLFLHRGYWARISGAAAHVASSVAPWGTPTILYSGGVAISHLGNTYLAGSTSGFRVPLSASFARLPPLGWGQNYAAVDARVVVVGPNDTVVLAGTFSGTLELDDGISATTHPPHMGFAGAGFVAQFSETGEPIWLFPMLPPDISGHAIPTDVSTGTDGSVVVVGRYLGAIRVGDETLPSSGSDMFVVKLSAGGDYAWARAYGTLLGTASGQACAVDSNNDVVFAATVDGPIDFGGGERTGGEIALVKLDQAGSHVWSKVFPASGTANAARVHGDRIHMGGTFSGAANFGGDDLFSTGGSDDAFIAVFNPAGGHLASDAFGSVSMDRVSEIIPHPSGVVTLAGTFHETIDVGVGPVASAGATDIFIYNWIP